MTHHIDFGSAAEAGLFAMSRSIEDGFKNALAEKLAEMSRPMIEEVATKLAKDCAARVLLFRNPMCDSSVVQVNFIAPGVPPTPAPYSAVAASLSGESK